MNRPYGTGMYGGKFLPPHLGHGYCIYTMAQLCDEGHVILFYGGDQEKEYAERGLLGSWAEPEGRLKHIRDFVSENGWDNITVDFIDITDCTTDGKEDWDKETPLVREILPKMDAVFTGGPQYALYFKRAYPEATQCLVDPFRLTYPISATMIRKDIKGLAHWMM